MLEVGRKNCKRCTRWRLLVDYTWRWRLVRSKGSGRKPRHIKPTIDGVCNYCRRIEEKNRYRLKTKEERKEIGRRANENRLKRIKKEQEKLDKTRALVRYQQRELGWENERVSIIPFRMWVIRQIRLRGSLANFANEIGYDQSLVGRWANGFYWEPESHPVPVYSIEIGTVDKVLTAAGASFELSMIYPLKDDQT